MRSMSSALSGSDISRCKASSSWCRSPTRPLPRDRFIQNRTALHLLDVLAKVADRQLLGDRDRALVGSFLADHHTEERCLARPIGTDQPNFFAGIQLKRSIHEEQLLPILLIDVGEGDHFEGATRGTLPFPV